MELTDFEKSRLYFLELEDALSHYSSPLPKGMFFTVTTRADEHGKQRAELVTYVESLVDK